MRHRHLRLPVTDDLRWSSTRGATIPGLSPGNITATVMVPYLVPGGASPTAWSRVRLGADATGRLGAGT